MNNWRKIKLKDICVLNYGKSLVASKRVKGTIPVYSSAGITGFHNVATINSAGLIIGRKGTVGSVYKSEVPFCCIDTAYYILPNPKDFDLDFLFYRLKILGLHKLNEDSAVPGLNRDTAYNQEFYLPNLDDQKRIAVILGALDDKIELNNKINKKLEEQASALFKHWFVDFEFLDANGKPYKSSGGAFKDSELGLIPSDWSIGTLGEMIEVKYGKDHKSLEAGTVPVYGSGGIMRFVDKYLYDKESVLIP
ncbi:MAG: restriction endonuclease subunit S, partial [Tannerellaceae bacterium]